MICLEFDPIVVGTLRRKRSWLRRLSFYPTKEVPVSKDLIGHINIRTPWWNDSGYHVD